VLPGGGITSSELGLEQEIALMGGLALALFVALYAFGDQFLDLRFSGGQVQLALFMAFIFGIVCGYRVKS
jgi:hypothetical protein